jgi:hypothetical protein
MKIRILNYAQFLTEKQKILSVVRAWQKIDNEFFDQCYSKLTNSGLRYHWTESVKAMIEFLEKDIPEKDGNNFEKNGFSFFIAEDDGDDADADADAEDSIIEGIALGSGIRTYGGYSITLFGTSGTFFEIKDMIIGASSMLPRCYPIENKVPPKRIGKELLKAIVNHLSTQDTPYPILARPHHNNETAHNFFEKYLFKLDCGSIGHSFTLNVADFIYIDQVHKEKIKDKDILVIEDYQGVINKPSIL